MLRSKTSTNNRVLRTGAVSQECEHFSAHLHETFPTQIKLQINNSDPFIEKADDELLGPSKEDDEFDDLMENNVTTKPEGNFVLPLPLKRNAVLPDNKIAVYMRSKNTLNRILRDSDKADKCASWKNISPEVMSNKFQTNVSKRLACHVTSMFFLLLRKMLTHQKFV